MPSTPRTLLMMLTAITLLGACKSAPPAKPPVEITTQPVQTPPPAREVLPPDPSPALGLAEARLHYCADLAQGAALKAAQQALARDPFSLLASPKEARGQRDLVIVAVGDVSQPAKQWREHVDRLKTRAFAPTQHLLDSGDLVSMNLENPISELQPSAKKTYSFTSPPERLGWYFDVGFNLFSLSNNHIADADQQGIDDTLMHLQRERSTRGVQAWWAGAGTSPQEAEQVTWVEPQGKNLKIAYFSTGFSKSSNVSKFWSESLVQRIKEARKTADIVVVAVHAGKEYQHVPEANTTKIFHDWVDAGADLVIGHHPHVIRPVEVYKQGLILHSLGNYVFASRTVRYRKSGAKMYGLLARVIIQDARVAGVELTPTWVNNSGGWSLPDGQKMPNANFAPLLITGDFADAFFDDFAQWTTEAGATPIQREGDTGRIIISAPKPQAIN